MRLFVLIKFTASIFFENVFELDEKELVQELKAIVIFIYQNDRFIDVFKNLFELVIFL